MQCKRSCFKVSDLYPPLHQFLTHFCVDQPCGEQAWLLLDQQGCDLGPCLYLDKDDLCEESASLSK
jgi:hypothetical protein